MTTIRPRLKPVWHETRASFGTRKIVVAETPSCLLVRPKGTRTALRLPWTVALLKAAELEARQTRLERLQARRGRKKGGAVKT